MTVSNILLIGAAIFILIGFLLGLKRGFARSFLRLVFVVAIALASFYVTDYVAKQAMVQVVAIDGVEMTVKEFLSVLLHQTEGVAEIISNSPTLEGFILAAPEALFRVVGFVIIFFLLKLVSVPVTAIINAIFFPKKKDGKSVNRHALLGSLVGAVQGFFCFLVVMVLFFGVIDVARAFVTAYDSTENEIEELTEVCDTIKNEALIPLSENKVIDLLDKTPIPAYCVEVFHKLAYVDVSTEEGVEDKVYYFEELKSMFPTVIYALELQGMDPDHLTPENSKSLVSVIVSMKNNEKGQDIVGEVVDAYVQNAVAPEYQKSAGAFVHEFLDVVFEQEEEVLQEIDVEKESESITECLGLLAIISSTETESAFTEETVSEFFETVAESAVVSQTLINVSKNQEMVDTILGDMVLDKTAKENTQQVINDYKNAFLENNQGDQEKIDRVNAVIAAVLDALNLTSVDELG
ncbi:MAG: CvpA family protein [Clostridia bacterium]|nr:CvpA family protein [Clostridia bacterium]